MKVVKYTSTLCGVASHGGNVNKSVCAVGCSSSYFSAGYGSAVNPSTFGGSATCNENAEGKGTLLFLFYIWFSTHKFEEKVGGGG